MTGRRQHRQNRRGQLRYRAPRFDNRRRKPGTLPPSVDTLRVVNTVTQIYPISSISIERNKLDPQLMANPDIRGVEYQRGTLFGWQVRAYALVIPRPQNASLAQLLNPTTTGNPREPQR